MFCLIPWREIDQAHFEQINRQRYLFMFPDLLPCPGHSFRPVNIIKNKQGLLRYIFNELIKIPECCLFVVMSVNEYKVKRFLFRN
jgi:hypothetical protein